MTWKYKREKTLWYVYPVHHTVSFTLVARKYIEQLRKAFTVQEVGEKGFLNIFPATYPTVLIHPLIYIAGGNFEKYMFVRSRFNKVLGFEVADSDRISDSAVNICNTADAIILPSNFAKESYINSGVNVPIYVVPHGLGDEYYRSPREPKREELRLIKRIKEEKNYVYLLFFLWHSGHRKGADLVYHTINKLSKERPNVVLILKGSGLSIGASLSFDQSKTVLITGWLDNDDVVDLYDLADIYPLFSRGGGFELNGLEALARGVITLAAEKGSWTDYLPKEFLLPIARWVDVLPGNPYHVGKGPEIDVDKAVDRLVEIIDDLDEWKAKAREYAEKVKERFSWTKIGEQLIKVVENYV